MKIFFFLFMALTFTRMNAQNWHFNVEPVYFFTKAPNVALDYNINSSVAVGFQYAALNWAENGNNLSGFQIFYSRNARLNKDSEVLKLYIGLLSANTTLLAIEAKEKPLPLYEVLYGYRWVFKEKFTVAVLAGTFFTSSKIYPSVSIPVGYLF